MYQFLRPRLGARLAGLLTALWYLGLLLLVLYYVLLPSGPFRYAHW